MLVVLPMSTDELGDKDGLGSQLGPLQSAHLWAAGTESLGFKVESPTSQDPQNPGESGTVVTLWPTLGLWVGQNTDTDRRMDSLISETLTLWKISSVREIETLCLQ